ncbi:molybdate ABC transporter substrate-binding protein [Microbacterium sp. NPDC076911]|uniref:molybdate ABC transporter substrate-binding protein n=1 Tax=Microbacterium sp. NPDC076911 TaxID=3154958 RepID=UPI00343D6518
MSKRLRRLPAAFVAGAISLAIVGCGNGDATSVDDPGAELHGELTIFAAASLGAAFNELASEFEEMHTAVDIRPISYDGSSVLATQLIEGAPADVFASADERNMIRVVGESLADNAQFFASNTLVIAVPSTNPGEVTSITDLADPDLTVVLCAPEVPCGSAAQTLLGYGDVHVVAASLEQNVTAVLTKVAAGEADAGLVYASDVQGRDDVEVIVPEGAESVVNHYPIASLLDASDPEIAQAFIGYVLSDDGQAVLQSWGFDTP